jgi:hypothetical protein
MPIILAVVLVIVQSQAGAVAWSPYWPWNLLPAATLAAYGIYRLMKDESKEIDAALNDRPAQADEKRGE